MSRLGAQTKRNDIANVVQCLDLSLMPNFHLTLSESSGYAVVKLMEGSSVYTTIYLFR